MYSFNVVDKEIPSCAYFMYIIRGMLLTCSTLVALQRGYLPVTNVDCSKTVTA